MREAARLLERFPEAGQGHIAGTRRLLLDPFPYSLIYRLTDAGIVIIAVAHAAQRPGYWEDR